MIRENEVDFLLDSCGNQGHNRNRNKDEDKNINGIK